MDISLELGWLESSIREFFSDSLFENLEPEIKQRAEASPLLAAFFHIALPILPSLQLLEFLADIY